MSKSVFLSRTFWVNLVALVIAGLEKVAGLNLIDPETLVTIIAALNILLRFVTRKPVTLSLPS